jgi:hypothetical protein
MSKLDRSMGGQKRSLENKEVRFEEFVIMPNILGT